jgi:hypothetical protein
MAVVVGDVQWDAMLKELYPDGVPRALMQRTHSFMSLVAKDDNATGEYMVIPVVYDLPPGRSALAGTAFSDTGPWGASKHAKFTPSLVEDYASTRLNMLTVYKTANDRGSFVEMRKREIDGILKQLGNSLAHALFRDGTGALGQIASGAGTATITLVNKSDAKFFTVGGQYQVSTGPTTPGALRDAGDFVTAIAVDEDAGTVTADAVWSTQITGATTNDFLIMNGDLNEKVTGLAGWLPLTTPTSTPFFGVDRTVHPTRLAGNRLDQPNVPAEDTIVELAEIMRERGAMPDRCFVSPRQFSKIAKRLGSKIEYNGGGGTADVAFSGVKLWTSAGAIELTADSDCPDNRGYILEMDSWRLKHLLDLPHIVIDDGVRALRVKGADQIEIRARYYGQLVCYEPGHNGVFSCSL